MPTNDTSKIYIVFNPVAGNANADTVRQALNKYFSNNNVPAYSIYETTGQENLSEVVHQALNQGFNLFVAAGGDGTVAGVAGGLADTDIPLGIIPLGTGNALALKFNIPLDLEPALQLLVGRHAVQTMDAMQVEDRFLLLNITIGLTSLIMRDTEYKNKRRFGRLAYVWAGLLALFNIQPRRFTIGVDGQYHQVWASEIAVTNVSSFGASMFRWGPHIRSDDAQLDVVIVRSRTIWDYLQLAWHTILNQHKRDPNVNYLSARQSVTVKAGRPLIVQGDGDIIGQTPVRVKIVPNAVQIIVPPKTNL
ncbi:MAG: diacylglycerol kinase family lipid kinase [Anaerolineae bacterium]|nr:diacylglycerol kinase family lipid kinase [Anaerolineae bacterium]